MDALDELHDRLRIAWLGEDETTTSFLDLLLRQYCPGTPAEIPAGVPGRRLETLYDRSAADAVKALGKLLLEKLRDGRC